MSFLYPSLLWLLIPLILYGYFSTPRTLKHTVHLLIMALILVALSRPRIAHHMQPAQIAARDILVALDVSYSMRAEDIAPNRYDFARRTIEALITEDAKDNVMLIAFTTNPLILAPPTTDHALVSTALHALDPDNILTKGTSLKRLFEQIAALPPLHREVVLITDGGEERDLATLLNTIGQSDTTLHILAMGTEAGTTVPLQGGEALKDTQGHLVISRINPLLKTLAAQTGGTYTTPGSDPKATAHTLLKQIIQSDTSLRKITRLKQGYSEYYQLPLLLALLLLLMLYTRASRYLVLLFALLHLPLQASVWESWQLHHAYTLYAQGDYNQSKALLENISHPSLQQRDALAASYYRLGAFQKAADLYRTIRTTSPKIKQRLYYNTANAYAKLGRYTKAKIYYTKALQLGEDADALHNLQLVTFLLEHTKAHGRTLPKSQGEQGKAPTAEMTPNKKDSEDNQRSGSGSGGGGDRRTKDSAASKKRLLLPNKEAPKQPLGSKVYELINKGYIHEKQPW